jgi:RNA polymerase sigma factor (sigma-70 family)
MPALSDRLRNHDFPALFIDALGWDRSTGSLPLCVNGRSLKFTMIAQKRGIQVIICASDRLVLLNRRLLRDFQRQVARTFHEHILIFTSEEPRKQVWQWAIRQSDGGRLRHREHPFFSGNPPPQFLERLEELRFTIEEEESITLLESLSRVRRALDVSAELNLFAKRPWYAERSDELFRAARDGNPASFRRFVQFHIPLARWFAKRWHSWLGVELEDAEQIAVFGLIAATRRFRPELGYQFATYAGHWIRQALQRHGPEVAYFFRIPPHALRVCLPLRSKLNRMIVAAGHYQARAFLSQAEAADATFARQWLGFHRATTIRSFSNRQEPEFHDARQIAGPEKPPWESLIRAESVMAVRNALDRLHPRFVRILRLRYGFDGESLTLAEIGRREHLTRERVRQLEAVAERKLRDLLISKVSLHWSDGPNCDTAEDPIESEELAEDSTVPAFL